MKIDLQADVFSVLAGEGEEKTRTIAGVAVPYGVDATALTGPVRIEKGAIRAEGKPKFIRDHDLSKPLGVVSELIDTEDALLFEAKISATRDGDEALVLAADGVLDSVSVGLDVEDFEYDGRTMVVKSAVMKELSLLAYGAFQEAKIASVAASEPENPTEPEGESDVENENQVEAAEPATIETPKVYAAPKSYKLPSAGEYILAMKRGGHDFAQLNDNIKQVFAATGDVLVSDAAVVPTPIVAPVYSDINPLRPIVTALGTRAMPEAGATFIRPYVKVHSSVAAQSSELAGLSTADFEVDDITITKKTFGGKLVLSEQVIDWSSPSMLDQAITDMAGQYALATEDYTVDQMAAAVTNSQEVVITSFTDEEEFIRDIYLAAASIATTGNYLPNVLAVHPDRWATLGGLVDGQGRAVFPQAMPVNSVGTLPGGVTAFNGNPLGLNLLVSNQIGTQAIGNKTAKEYYWLMNSRGVEVYEQYKGFLRDESVGTLGVTVAVRGYFAAHVVDVNMIRILGPDATFA